MGETLAVTFGLWVFFGPWGKQIRDEVPFGVTLLEAALAGYLAAVFAPRAGWTPEQTGWAALALWPVVYVVSCWRWSARTCRNPRCPRKLPRDVGGGGLHRPRATCGWCGGRDVPRLGARLLFGGRDDD